MDIILANFIWLIGNGEHINLWLDNWRGTPLVSIFNTSSFHLSPFKQQVIYFYCRRDVENSNCLFWLTHWWRLPGSTVSHSRWYPCLINVFGLTLQMLTSLPNMLSTICIIILLLWTELLSFGVHAFLLPTVLFYWRLMHRKLPTDENLRSHGCVLVYICILCYTID